MLPEVIDPLLAIINSSLSLGYVPKTFKLAVIKPLQDLESGPVLTYISLLIIPCMIVYVTNNKEP